MTDVLAQLEHASFRGISFPVMGSRDFGFQHAQEKHRFLFRDEELVEALGRENPTYRYTIPFREDIAKGPWRNLFTVVYPLFLEACLDRSNGDLGDPLHGLKQVRCVSLQETISTEKKDGVDVDVVFVTSPDEDSVSDPEELTLDLSSIQGAESAQGFFDKAAGKVDSSTAARLAALNKGAEFAKLDPLSAATGALNQIETAGNKFDASVGAVAFKMQRLDASLARLQDPKTQPLRHSTRQLELAARNVQRTALGGSRSTSKRVRQYAVKADIGRLALAGNLGMTAAQLLQLNPLIARLAVVKSGTTVLYFAG